MCLSRHGVVLKIDLYQRKGNEITKLAPLEKRKEAFAYHAYWADLDAYRVLIISAWYILVIGRESYLFAYLS
jgi:hypothetical protein